MKTRKPWFAAFFFLFVVFVSAPAQTIRSKPKAAAPKVKSSAREREPAPAPGQFDWPSSPQSITDALRELVETPAVPGYEQELAGKIVARLKSFSRQYQPKTDNLSNVTVTIGSGAPHRLMVAPIDEPGYVVSGITSDGYLTLQRLPQGGNLPLFNELYAAQPVKIQTAGHQWISGAVAGVSIHLQPQRQHPPSASDLDNMYVDIGAATAAQARASGADVLSPLALDRTFFSMAGGKYTSPAIGDRFGAATLVELLRVLDPGKIKGTLTVAFVTQQWLGGRGLQKLLYQLNPDELVYVGRLMRPALPPAGTAGGAQRESALGFKQPPGSGVLIASAKPEAELNGLAAELKQLAGQNNIASNADFSAPFLPPGGYLRQAKLPERTVHLAIATAWPSTPAEVMDGQDMTSLASLLELYLLGSAQKPSTLWVFPTEPAVPDRPDSAPAPQAVLKQLIETYGVSGGHEANVRQAVTQLLPAWAKPETDDAGNLILRWQSNVKGPRIAVVAHMDEIGYEVHSILPDGRLELETKGGGVLAYFLGHAALIHSGTHMFPGVLELPDGWEKPDFQWPRGPRMMFHMNIGAHTPEDVSKIGIKAGDWVTIPKKYHKLLGTRAMARAFDDRVGCAALVSAAWALGPDLKARDVTFIWSTSEEIGLEGAAAAAKRLAGQGQAPDYVFAVDTFVSSDSPLESQRFGDARLGQGFVVRAVDNSNVVPRKLVEKMIGLAHAAGAPVQYGVTGGGNDGSAFLLYGSTDIALGWPLRYSHSPGEVIDVRDLDALAKVIAAVARSW